MKVVVRVLINLLAILGLVWSGIIIFYTENEDILPFALAFAAALTLACISRLVSEGLRLKGKEPLPKKLTRLLWAIVIVLFIAVSVKDIQNLMA